MIRTAAARCPTPRAAACSPPSVAAASNLPPPTCRLQPAARAAPGWPALRRLVRRLLCLLSSLTTTRARDRKERPRQTDRPTNRQTPTNRPTDRQTEGGREGGRERPSRHTGAVVDHQRCLHLEPHAIFQLVVEHEDTLHVRDALCLHATLPQLESRCNTSPCEMPSACVLTWYEK